MREEVTSDLVREVVYSTNEIFQSNFREHLGTEVEAFIEAFTLTYQKYKDLDSLVVDDRSAWVQAFLYCALSSLLISTHLLVSGFPIQSGNSMRQFTEALSMALLCSHPAIDVFERFERAPKEFPTHKALILLNQKRNRELLDLSAEGLDSFKKIASFYDQYSHASALGVANLVMLDFEGVVLGSNFDPAKLEMYALELSRRVTAPEPMSHVIDRIRKMLVLDESSTPDPA